MNEYGEFRFDQELHNSSNWKKGQPFRAQYTTMDPETGGLYIKILAFDSPEESKQCLDAIVAIKEENAKINRMQAHVGKDQFLKFIQDWLDMIQTFVEDWTCARLPKDVRVANGQAEELLGLPITDFGEDTGVV
jgi:hypothetical protein